MKEIIESRHNDFVMYVRSLHQKSKRDNLNQFFIEGARIVKDALESGASFEFVLAIDGINLDLVNEIIQKGIKVFFVSEKVFKEISDTDTPQGILAVINKKEQHLDKNRSFIVILENIQDPGNMGTIIRTADAAGVDAILVSKGCTDIYNPKAVRSTMGSIFHIPIIKTDDLIEQIYLLKENGFKIYAAHLDGIKTHFEADMKGKCAVVIGNEANGISDEVTKMCQLIKIPMPGDAESLNASVSAGIIIYEYVRQKLIIK